MNTFGLVGGIIVIILALVLLYMGIMGIVKGKIFNKKIKMLPEAVQPKAAKIYGVGSIVSAVGALLIALNLMKDIVGFEITSWPGLIVLAIGLIIESYAQQIKG